MESLLVELVLLLVFLVEAGRVLQPVVMLGDMCAHKQHCPPHPAGPTILARPPHPLHPHTPVELVTVIGKHEDELVVCLSFHHHLDRGTEASKQRGHGLAGRGGG